MKFAPACLYFLSPAFLLFCGGVAANDIESVGTTRTTRRLGYLTEEDIRRKKDKKPKRGAFTPIRILVDDTPVIDRTMSRSTGDDAIVAAEAALNVIMPDVLDEIQSIIYVDSPMEPVNLRLRGANCEGVQLPEAPMVDGDFHLIIDAVRDSEDAMCGDNHHLAALSVTCAFDDFPLNPRAGIIRLCLDRINVSEGAVSEDEINRLTSLYMGEMATVLGASVDLFASYNDPATGEPSGFVLYDTPIPCLDGSTTETRLPAIIQPNTYGNNDKSFFEVTTPLVTQVARNMFGCQTLTGARLENQPLPSLSTEAPCFGNGWDLRLFPEEVWSAHMDASTAQNNVLSPLTLALLEDSGWYRVDFSQAGALSFGMGAGCSFVEDDCIDADQGSVMSPGSRGIFCNNDEDYVACDPTYQYQAECELDHRDLPPVKYQYFPSEERLAGDSPQFDYCPRLTLWMESCEGKTCFRRVDDHSICLEAECDDGEVEFLYGEEAYKCSEDFEIIDIVVDEDDETQNFQVECPRLASVCPELACPAACSGRGECINDGKKIKCSCEKEYKSDGCFLDLEAPGQGKNEGKKKEEPKEKKGGGEDDRRLDTVRARRIKGEASK